VNPCPACRFAGNMPDARFCSRCGAALAGSPPWTAPAGVPAGAGSADTPGAVPSAPVMVTSHQGTLAGVDYKVVGYETQAAIFQLAPNQSVQAEPGVLLYMRGDVAMSTGTGGGVMAGLKRMVAGDSFFLSTFSSAQGGELAFAAPYPGTIHPLTIGAPQSWLCQRHSFLCCSPRVTVSIALSQKLGYGLFSGEGFILQELAGQGGALVHAGGHFIPMELAAGEQIRVEAGTVVAFESAVQYDIEFVKGFNNLLFGGEGMFFVVLTGPGRVILQTLSFNKLVGRIAAQAQHEAQGGTLGQTVGTVAGLGALGGLVSGILGGGGDSGNSW